jgi:CheY-like chemotaxis protein/serine phosphatase RsbU (regulator of sigma subunit)
MNEEINLRQASILIVDDNVKNLQVLGGFLKIEGHSVEFALDGISALRWLDKKKFDLILLDIMMPGMDGYEVCSVIKKNPLISEIPVIFITAKTDSESIVKGFETGAVDYITKPFIQSELIVRVKTQLSISRSNERILFYLHEIEERNTNIKASIEYAKYIQTAVLSTSEKYFQYLSEHFFLYLPKDILSGDFYWVCKTGKKLIIAVMDCTGHGVPGALLSILGITLLNETVVHEHILQPDKILESLRTKIIRSLGQKDGERKIKDGIEGIVINYEPDSGKLQYSGSFNPLILIHAGELTTIKADSFSIGFSDENKNFTLNEIYVEANDAIYMFSDGIIDQFGGPVNRRFMVRHLKEIFFRNYDADMKLQKEILQREINSWKGDLVQTDDIIVMGIKF